jgi:hypothetical protein
VTSKEDIELGQVHGITVDLFIRSRDESVLDPLLGEAHSKLCELVHLGNDFPRIILPSPLAIGAVGLLSRTNRRCDPVPHLRCRLWSWLGFSGAGSLSSSTSIPCCRKSEISRASSDLVTDPELNLVFSHSGGSSRRRISSNFIFEGDNTGCVDPKVVADDVEDGAIIDRRDPTFVAQLLLVVDGVHCLPCRQHFREPLLLVIVGPLGSDVSTRVEEACYGRANGSDAASLPRHSFDVWNRGAGTTSTNSYVKNQ